MQSTIDAIRGKTETVYQSKMETLNFIDTNTQTSLLEPDKNKVSRDEVRNLLVETISNQMREAQEKGEEYTIQNLTNLMIEGHELEVKIENDIANVTIDGYKFTIDAAFNLSDVD